MRETESTELVQDVLLTLYWWRYVLSWWDCDILSISHSLRISSWWISPCPSWLCTSRSISSIALDHFQFIFDVEHQMWNEDENVKCKISRVNWSMMILAATWLLTFYFWRPGPQTGSNVDLSTHSLLKVCDQTGNSAKDNIHLLAQWLLWWKFVPASHPQPL